MFLLNCKAEVKRQPICKTYFKDQIWEKNDYAPIEDILLKIDNDDVLDTIRICKIQEWTDPGDFQKIEIKLSNKDFYEIYNLGDWINLNNEQLKLFGKSNIVKTDRFLITEIEKGRIVMIIFGWQYASSPGNISIIDLTNGNIKPLFNKLFEFISLEDIDNNNVKEIIGLSFYRETCCYSDSVSWGFTYMPYHVLKIEKDTVQIDLHLTEEYNYKNYVGYFGTDYDQEMRYLTVEPYTDYKFEPYFLFEKYRDFPKSSLEFLTKEELKNYSKSELRLLRNEIFAFHGYIFSSQDLKDYFSKKDWYKPAYKDVNHRLNKFEKANIKLIKELESINN